MKKTGLNVIWVSNKRTPGKTGETGDINTGYLVTGNILLPDFDLSNIEWLSQRRLQLLEKCMVKCILSPFQYQDDFAIKLCL